jgi:hypothetical protein
MFSSTYASSSQDRPFARTPPFLSSKLFSHSKVQLEGRCTVDMCNGMNAANESVIQAMMWYNRKSECRFDEGRCRATVVCISSS